MEFLQFVRLEDSSDFFFLLFRFTAKLLRRDVVMLPVCACVCVYYAPLQIILKVISRTLLKSPKGFFFPYIFFLSRHSTARSADTRRTALPRKSTEIIITFYAPRPSTRYRNVYFLYSHERVHECCLHPTTLHIRWRKFVYGKTIIISYP
jgi:hypothetical protein